MSAGVEIPLTDNSLEVIQFRDKEEPTKGVLLLTNTYGIGGGPEYMSLWVYDKSQKRFRNILPSGTYVPALGTFRFFPSLRNKNVLIIARPERLVDFSANLDDPNRETIWDLHYYILYIYRHVPNKGFLMTGWFKTKRKYDPENDIGRLIDLELKRVMTLLEK